MAREENIYNLKIEAGKTATEKGFWDDYDHVDERFPECIALIHSELSEALEAHREGNIHEKDGVQEELADTVIRIFDLMNKVDRDHDADCLATMIEKMDRNKDREHKHGKEY